MMASRLFFATAALALGCGGPGADAPPGGGGSGAVPAGAGSAPVVTSSGGGANVTPSSGGAPFASSGGAPGAAGSAVAGGGGVTSLSPGSCGGESLDPTLLPPCSTCTGGRCVAKADFPQVSAALVDACDANSVCLPDSMVATNGNVRLAPCRSVLGNEGRCTSLCIPLVRSLSGVLPRDVCAEDERCGPCFNPTDGTETGLCRIGCDPGPTSQGILFSKCCSGRGDCVPRADVPGPASASLGRDTCVSGGDDLVCVPSSIVKDPTYRFPSCTSSVSVPGVAAGPGVCVPDCIVNSNPLGKFLGAGTCTVPGDKCAPCNDPTGKPTGACAAP